MSRILGIGEQFPKFSAQAVVSTEKGKEFATLDNKNISGKWAVIFFWPMDFTFVCPTEIAEFNRELRDFRDRDTVVIGASTDSQFVHLAWRKDHNDLKDLGLPMLADNRKELSEAM